MADLQEQLSALIEQAEGMPLGHRMWLEDPPVSVYVRWTSYWLGGDRYSPAVVIANVSVADGERGNGHFTRFLEDVERLADELHRAVVIESVLEERFRGFFERRGYRKRDANDNPAPVYVRPLDGGAKP